MPKYARRGYKRRRRPWRRRRRRRMVRVPKSMVAYNGIKKFKVTGQFTAITNGLGELVTWFAPFSLTRGFNQNLVTDSINPDVTQCLDSLFDMYKVTGVKIEFLPDYLDMNQSLQGGAVGNFGSAPMLLTASDPDNVGAILQNDIYDKNDLKIKSPFRRWRLFVRPKPNIQGLSGASSAMGLGGWLNLQNEQSNVAGTITIRSDKRFTNTGGDSLPNLPVGQYLVTYYVAVKIRN